MFYSVLAVLIVGPLRDLTACKSQAFKIAGQNIMGAPASIEASVLFEPLHDLDHKTRAILVFSHVRDMYCEVNDEHAWINFMDSVRSLVSLSAPESLLQHVDRHRSSCQLQQHRILTEQSSQQYSLPMRGWQYIHNTVCRQVGFKVRKEPKGLEHCIHTTVLEIIGI